MIGNQEMPTDLKARLHPVGLRGKLETPMRLLVVKRRGAVRARGAGPIRNAGACRPVADAAPGLVAPLDRPEAPIAICTVLGAIFLS